MTDLNFKNRNIAITDLETTGLIPYQHEIIEIGLVLVRQPDLEIIDTLDIKITPQNIELATPRALEINGYNPKDWLEAISLEEGLNKYFNLAKDAMFSAYSVYFDLPFIIQACKKTGVQSTLDYHSIDIPTLVWHKYRKNGLKRINLNTVAEYLGLEPEPPVHRAINGAMLAYQVLKKVVEKPKEPTPPLLKFMGQDT